MAKGEGYLKDGVLGRGAASSQDWQILHIRKMDINSEKICRYISDEWKNDIVKYIVHCYNCNSSLIEENRENSLFSKRENLLLLIIPTTWTAFQSYNVKLKSSFTKKLPGNLLVSNVFWKKTQY